MRLHRGTQGPQKTPCSWIEPRTTWQWGLTDLVDGLCSHYFRHRTDDDDPLPETLTGDRLIEIVKGEYEQHGTDNVWTWSDNESFVENEESRTWACGLVLAVLPGLAYGGES